MAKAIEVNCTTGEVTERDLTAAELQAQADAQAQAEAERIQAEADAATKATAKTALLKRLNMTAEEAALLLS
tara:strand:- start:1347 stop:1562 length:216 start_codon:yes stop_codon:yes gene_type:complete